MALKRKIPNAKQQMHYGNNRIVFDSLKNKKEVLAQSTLEHVGYLALEADPDVKSYEPHPPEITIVTEDGKTTKTIFDARVCYMDGSTEYLEYKYSSELEADTDKGDRSRRQVSLQRAWCEAQGVSYRVVTDQDLIIGKPKLYNNLLFMTQRLRPERAGDSSQLLRERAMRVYERLKDLGGRAVIRDLIINRSDAEEVGAVMTSVCYLLIYRLITADLDTKDISFGMEVEVNETA